MLLRVLVRVLCRRVRVPMLILLRLLHDVAVERCAGVRCAVRAPIRRIQRLCCAEVGVRQRME